MLPNIADVKHMNMIVDINDGNPMFSAVYTDARFGRIVHLTIIALLSTHSNNSSTYPYMKASSLNNMTVDFRDSMVSSLKADSETKYLQKFFLSGKR